jgi:hypothetical protein
MIVTPATILNPFFILSLKNFAFSGGDDGGPSDAEKYCEDSDPSDADANGVDIDSSECAESESECAESESEYPETESVDASDDGWCEDVVKLDGGVSVVVRPDAVDCDEDGDSDVTCSNSWSHGGAAIGDPVDDPELEGLGNANP